ncbi:MAG TPA: FHA domain-containing protein [Chthoniobacteraceae bacterium]|nr:FHA domain-containing protein [Chthoniobacteraceae bacterium]
MPQLVISLPDAGEVIHELTQERITVGRSDDNTIPLDDASVSSHHAELTRKNGGYFLKDLGSTNGTRLNRTPVSAEQPLKEGDRLRFGKVEAIYESNHKQQPLPPPKEEAASATPATDSRPPADFGNASPFHRKNVKKDPLNLIAIVVAVIGLLAAAAVAMTISQVTPPAL